MRIGREADELNSLSLSQKCVVNEEATPADPARRAQNDGGGGGGEVEQRGGNAASTTSGRDADSISVPSLAKMLLKRYPTAIHTFENNSVSSSASSSRASSASTTTTAPGGFMNYLKVCVCVCERPFEHSRFVLFSWVAAQKNRKEKRKKKLLREGLCFKQKRVM